MTTPDPLLRMAEFIEVFGSAPEDAAILRAAHAVIEAARLRGTYTHHGRDTRIEDCPTCKAIAAYEAACKEIK